MVALTNTPEPAQILPADFNHTLALAKLNALTIVAALLADAETPPLERRRLAALILRANFLPMPKPLGLADAMRLETNPDSPWGANADYSDDTESEGEPAAAESTDEDSNDDTAEKKSGAAKCAQADSDSVNVETHETNRNSSGPAAPQTTPPPNAPPQFDLASIIIDDAMLLDLIRGDHPDRHRIPVKVPIPPCPQIPLNNTPRPHQHLPPRLIHPTPSD
ncbi:hypothetical protein BH11PLA1_BH11PLA1_08720 [soil metagenome]